MIIKRIAFNLLVAIGIWMGNFAQAQCPNNNSQTLCPAFDASTLTLNNRTFVCGTVWGGEYQPINNVTAGNTYRVDFCTNGSNTTNYDSYLTVYTSTGTLVGFNDNFCGDDGQLDFVAPVTGQYWILADVAAGCGSNSNNTSVSITLTGLGCTGPTITSSPVTVVACPNSAVFFVAATGGTVDSVRWQGSTNGGGTWTNLSNVAPFSGVTTNTLSINPTSLLMNGTMVRMAAYKCSPVQSAFTSPATLFVGDNLPPNIICPGPQNLILGPSCSATLPDYRGLANVTDNCPSNPTVTQSPLPGTVISTPGAITVTLTATDAGSNFNTCNFTVNVMDNQVPTFSNCPNNITQNIDSTQCTANITWTPPTAVDNCSATSSSSHSPGNSFSPGTTTVTYTATDPSGNTGTCSFTVTVNQAALAVNLSAFDYGGGANISCAGVSDGQATVFPSGGCTPYSYLWSNGAATATVTGLSALSYTVTVTDGSGNSQVGQITLQGAAPLAGPFISIGSGGQTNCVGDTVLLNGAGGFANYAWSTGSTNTSTIATQSGDVFLTVTNSNGCIGLDSINLVFNSNPSPVITQNGSTLSSTPATTYQWYLNGVLLPGETNQTLVVTTNGNYTVVVTDANGCEGTSNIIAINLSISDGIANSLTITPNPFGTAFTVEMEMDQPQKVNLMLFDVNGKLIWQGAPILASGKFHATVEQPNLPSGVYFLSIHAGENFIRKQVVKL